MADYTASLPDSFISSTRWGSGKTPLTTFKFDPSLDATKVTDFTGTTAFNPSTSAQTPSWTFITAPEDVSWDLANQADRVNVFGTNNPPVVSGTKGMRDLTLSNSLVEGFVRGVNVEKKISSLEDLMLYKENLSDGYVSVPVYQVWASEKSYGGSNAYYIIKDVKIKESMRDLSGNATRAYVDISLMEVPEYQVNSGRDQASATTAGVKSPFISDSQVRSQTPAAAANATATTRATQVPASAKSGPQAPAPAPPPGPQGRPNRTRLGF